MHVIAALQGDIRKVGAGLAEEVSRLLSAYVWRSFLTERYKTQANDRLLEDFQGLRQYLLLLSGGASGQDRLRLTDPLLTKRSQPRRSWLEPDGLGAHPVSAARLLPLGWRAKL